MSPYIEVNGGKSIKYETKTAVILSQQKRGKMQLHFLRWSYFPKLKLKVDL